MIMKGLALLCLLLFVVACQPGAPDAGVPVSGSASSPAAALPIIPPDHWVTPTSETPVWVLTTEGKALVNKHEYHQALDKLNEAMAIDDQDVDAYIYRGQAYTGLKQYPAAIQDLQKAIELKPTNSLAYTSLGWVALQQNDYTKALEMAGQARKFSPDDPANYLISSQAHEYLGQGDQAEADVTSGLARAPANVDLLNQRCWLGGLNGKAADFTIQQACDQAVDLASQKGLVRDSRALVRALNGDLTGAADDLRLALPELASDPSFGPALVKERQGFLDALDNGTNPFDAATLEKLRLE